MFESCLSKMAPYAPLPLRLILGAVFMAHGGQKLFGWFGGHGFQGTVDTLGQMFASTGSPPIVTAALAGGGEFFGGLLVLLGLLTRIGGFLIACTMMIAVFLVHWQQGFFASDGGFEYPLSLLAIAVSLMMSGGGTLSLDRLLNLKCAQ